MSSTLDERIAKIAGQVVTGQNPGIVLKTWRERLQVKQGDLAQEMRVSASVLSDYESGRRLSPGVRFIRKYVEALVKVDEKNKRLLGRFVNLNDNSAILSLGEFKQPIKARNLAEILKGEVLRGQEYLDLNIYGYTLLDSIKTIYALSGFDFYRIFGATTERALIFTKVGLGRSPLVAIRVSQLKPRMVVLHGPQTVDPIAIDLAEKERIVLTLSSLPSEKAFENTLKGL